MTSKTAQFSHKGVAISIDARGRFTAKINGQQIDAPSLDAVKVKIDKTAPFTPFDAFVLKGWDRREIDEFRVIGIRKDPGRRGALRWVTDRNQAYQHVYRASPEALERARKFCELAEAEEERHEKAEKELEDLLGKVGDEVSAAEYQP